MLSRPELEEHLHFAWQVFSELHEQRLCNENGPQPLTVRQLLDYAELWQFSRQDAQDIWEVVRRIDRIWRRLDAERQESTRQEPRKVKPPTANKARK